MSDAPRDSDDRRLINLIAEQAKGLESPLDAGRRIIAERAALLGVMQGLSLSSKEILARCGVDVGEDALPEPNAGYEPELETLSPASVELLQTLLNTPVRDNAGTGEYADNEVL